MRRIWKRAKPKEDKKFFINERIKSPTVFLINEDDEQIGVVSREEALRLAQEAEMDLVEVNPKAEPPVVKIIDFGQFKYRLDKKSQKNKIAQKTLEVKEIRLSVRISDHDLNMRLDQAKKFFEKGHKVKVEVILKGRERQYADKGGEVVRNFVNKLKEDPKLEIAEEQPLTKQGGRFNIVIVNKKQ